MRENPLHAKEISRIVARQLGHITRRQLLDAGLRPAWIERHVLSGELIPVHAGVYAVGHVPQHAHARAMAAVLACGPGAALSHLAAAALWGVVDWPPTFEVTAPRERRRPGIRSHRRRTLVPNDVRRRHGVPVTSPARTALDLQPRLTDAALVRLVNGLRTGGHLGRSAFAELCAGSVRIDTLLGDRDAGGFTRSGLEDLYRPFARRHDLPLPDFNVRLPESGREVDALYRAARVIVEIDSWKYHSNRASFERDRLLDAQASALRYRTVRVPDRQLVRGGDREAEIIRQLLAG